MQELRRLSQVSRFTGFTGFVAAFVFALFPRTAAAQPPDPALLERLAHHIAALDEIDKHATLHQQQRVEEIDGDGKVVHNETKDYRIEPAGGKPHQTLEHSVRDGQDTTAEEQERAKKSDEERRKEEEKKTDKDRTNVEVSIDLPFSAAAADSYVYDQVAVDPNDPTRVELSFTPKKASKRTVQGNAWVDTANGTLLTASARLSKPPMFVDWIHFTAEFAVQTPLGPALSRLTFDAKGGLLFIRKHFRGTVVSSDIKLAP